MFAGCNTSGEEFAQALAVSNVASEAKKVPHSQQAYFHNALDIDGVIATLSGIEGDTDKANPLMEEGKIVS